MKIKSNSTLLVMCIITLVSCSVSKKQRTVLNESLSKNRNAEEDFKNSLVFADSLRNAKLHAGELDSVTSGIAKAKIDSSLSASAKRIDEIKKYQQFVAASVLKQKQYKSVITFVANGPQILNVAVKVVALYTDLIQANTFSKFNTAAFFAPGIYQISDANAANAQNAFLPIVNSIFTFSKKYSDKPLQATIFCKGYSDATGFNEASASYTTLSNLTGMENPSKADLNFTLSYLRAQEISHLFKTLFFAKKAEIPGATKIVFNVAPEGMGEELPNKEIKDYTANDDRRRIVVVYWNVLPAAN